MADRGVTIDHTAIHRWVIRFSPVLLKRFNRRKRTVGGRWDMDETYIKVRGQWMYLSRGHRQCWRHGRILVQRTP